MTTLPRPVAVPTLDALARDPSMLDGLTPEVLLDLRAKVRHLDAGLGSIIERHVLRLGHPQAEGGEVLGIEDAARRLGTSHDTLYRKYRRLGIGYKDPLDGRVKFTAGEIERFIRRQKRG